MFNIILCISLFIVFVIQMCVIYKLNHIESEFNTLKIKLSVFETENKKFKDDILFQDHKKTTRELFEQCDRIRKTNQKLRDLYEAHAIMCAEEDFLEEKKRISQLKYDCEDLKNNILKTKNK